MGCWWRSRGPPGRCRAGPSRRPDPFRRRTVHSCRPDDVGTTELVEIWRARLFGDHGALNDKLIGAAA